MGDGAERSTHIPTALILIMLGLIISIVSNPDAIRDLKFGPSKVRLTIPSFQDFKIGFVRYASSHVIGGRKCIGIVQWIDYVNMKLYLS